MPSCASSERRTSSTSLSTSSCAIWSRNAISRTISAFMALSDSGALSARRWMTSPATVSRSVGSATCEMTPSS